MRRAVRHQRYIDQPIFNYRLYRKLVAVGTGPARAVPGVSFVRRLKAWGSGAVRVRALAAMIAATTALSPAAQAGDMPFEIEMAPPLRDRLFYFSGGDIARDSRFVWGGFVGALGGLLHEDGLRIRVMAGGGTYRYRTSAVPGGSNDGRIVSGEILFGVRRTIGPAEFTAYLGAHAESQLLALPDPGHRSQGTATGVKAAIELYTRLSPETFAVVTAAASTVHASYQLRGAFAREFSRDFAVGIETTAHGDARYVEPRIGAFAQITHGRTVFTLAGGYLSNSEKGGGPYATLAVYAPY